MLKNKGVLKNNVLKIRAFLRIIGNRGTRPRQGELHLAEVAGSSPGLVGLAGLMGSSPVAGLQGPFLFFFVPGASVVRGVTP